MEKFVDMISPLTGGRVKEVSTTEIKEFRKEKFRVHVRYYVCVDTGEQFTTTEQDNLQFNDLYSQYRVRHGIPFPDEIKSIRTKYGLNYSQISSILGFGANQYAKYEAGEMPSESNGKMIAAIRDRQVLMSLLRDCRESFAPAEYQRITTAIAKSDVSIATPSPLYVLIYQDNKRTVFNGYGDKNIDKLFEMVRYLTYRTGDIFPTKLNKLMFFADFHHYRQTGLSISGLRYRAFPYGPVPEHYATIYDNTPDLDRKIIEAHEMTGTLLYCAKYESPVLLSNAEIRSMDYVVNKFGNYNVNEIIDLSHQERGWKECVSARSWIPYDYAFDLSFA